VILDEIQYVPELLSYIKTSIMDSLSFLAEVLLRGFYPEPVINPKVDRKLWCASYITTYLERDIRTLSKVGDLHQFERFLVACAIRTGQILNLSDIARELGISVPTAKRWLSLLETGGQVFLLYPYFQSMGKRMVKSPKLYVTDPSICTYLLALHSPEVLLASPYLGSLFETMVIADILKRFYHSGEKPSLYYLRTRDGLEVDLVIEYNGTLTLMEMKATRTPLPKHAEHLSRAARMFAARDPRSILVSLYPHPLSLSEGVKAYPWDAVLGG